MTRPQHIRHSRRKAIGGPPRGGPRTVRMDVTRFDRPSHITLDGHADPFDLAINPTVVALSRVRSRLLKYDWPIADFLQRLRAA